MQPKLIRTILFVIAILLTCQAQALEISKDLKGGVREFLTQVTVKPPLKDFGSLPDGLEIIDGKGFRGIKIVQGKLEIRAHTWADDVGLLENYNRCKADGYEIIAAVNGAFYSERGVLGPVISDGTIPVGLRQIPGALSRCFVSSFRAAKGRQYWYLGETSLRAPEMLRNGFKERSWFNVISFQSVLDSAIDNLIGGGGWILRDRKDVHMEAYDRQRFRFRKEDQNSRKTVIAQDSDRNLYLLVFDNGFNFHMVARSLVKEAVFAKVVDAIFLDGGSSSAMVLNGKYLVSPLYMVDKSRFSCLQVLVPVTTW